MSFKKDFGLIVVGAIIFTASFLWKDLLSDIQEYYFPKKFGLTGRAMYVLIVSIILVMIAVHLRYRFGLVNDNNQNPIQFDDQPLQDTIANESMDMGGGAEGFHNLDHQDKESYHNLVNYY